MPKRILVAAFTLAALPVFATTQVTREQQQEPQRAKAKMQSGHIVRNMLPWGWGVKCDCRGCVNNGSTLTGCDITAGFRNCHYANGASYSDPCE